MQMLRLTSIGTGLMLTAAAALAQAPVPSKAEPPGLVRLSGRLTAGSVAVGGETTGYRLEIGSLDVDLSRAASGKTLLDHKVRIEGTLSLRSSPERGSVRVLTATRVDPAGAVPVPTTLTGDVLLVGTLAGGIVRPGGETTGYELRNVSVEIDPGRASNAASHVDKEVVAVGRFTPRHLVERGTVWVFQASEIRDAR